MGIVTTTAEPADAVLESACARQASAELHFFRGDGSLITARVRLLGLSGRRVLADRPMYSDGAGPIPLNRRIRVHVAIRGKRYQFDSAVESRLLRLPPGLGHSGPGIALLRPAVVARSQRRANVRVSMVGYDPVQVILAAACPSGVEACLLRTPLLIGWMVDLSAGGFSVLVDRRRHKKPKRGNHYFVTFRLPGVDEEFNLSGSVRHFRAASGGESIRLALALMDWNGSRLKRDQDRLSRFVADHERRMLRRKR